jgi:phosphate transport system permease protein
MSDAPDTPPGIRETQPGLGKYNAQDDAQRVAPGREAIPLPELERRLRSPRTFFDATLTLLTTLMALAALVPLFSVLYMLVVKGGQRLGIALFTELPPAIGMAGGGIGNALAGTLITVAIAVLFSVPFGVFAAVFLAEFDPDSRTAGVVRFCAKVLTGLPSVLAGLFAYAAVVLTMGSYSAFAGGFALALLMLPTVLLTAEQAITMVPQSMREAAIGMGATPTQVVWMVTLPTAMPGILTGVLLAVARAMGETAPLLFTALFSNYWPTGSITEPMATLAVLIFNFSGSPERNQQEIAWAASLVLVFIVLLANVAAQLWSRRTASR